MSANDRQEGGTHYKTGGEEHWDRVQRLGMDYFQACITKYVERCWKKNGIEDLRKAQHFLEKYIELNTPSVELRIEEVNAQNRIVVDRLSGIPENWTCVKCGNVRVSSASFWACTKGGECTFDDTRGIKPNGYVGFTYEGGTAMSDMYRCTSCREFLTIAKEGDPRGHHTSCPGPAYVRQEP